MYVKFHKYVLYVNNKKKMLRFFSFNFMIKKIKMVTGASNAVFVFKLLLIY